MNTTTKIKIPFNGIIFDVYKKMGEAIFAYNMLNPGDRVLIGVSGGVDSLSLVKLFQIRKRNIPIKFDLLACMVDTNFIKLDKQEIIDYVKSCDIDCLVKDLTIEQKDRNCFWCSWNRRKILFQTAKEYNCNKIALGHNLDDIVETILMNMFFSGQISAMKPKQELFKGKLSIIRPLCYLEKSEIIDFSKRFTFPIAKDNCQYADDSSRQFIRDIMPILDKESKQIKTNIFRSLGRIREDYLL